MMHEMNRTSGTFFCGGPTGGHPIGPIIEVMT
jgi:hypothetical protein